MKINTVIEGDCLEVMRGMPDNFVDTILTDPPYGLSFMGKKWDASGIAFNPEVWREALRVAKPGATLMAFGGTRTHHRLACAIEDAGWEIRDCVTYFHDGNQAEAALMASLNEEQLAAYLELHYPNHQLHWTFGSGFPKSLDIGKSLDKAGGAERKVIGNRWEHKYPNGPGGTGFHGGPGKYTQTGRGPEFITAPATPLAAKWDGWRSHGLKPAFEPIIVAIKPMGQSYAANAEAWGVAGLWIDGARIPTDGESLGRVSPGIKSISRQNFNQDARPEFYYRDQESRFIDNSGTKGRYPGNVIVSGEPQTEAEFAKAGVRRNAPRGKPSNGLECSGWGGYNSGVYYKDGSTSASRYFAHCPPDTEPARLIYQAKASGKERGVYNNHPTVKSLELVKYLCRLTKTPDGGIILDPFGGSGTTALACISEGRDYILIEKEADYAELCRRRIAEYTGAEIAPKEIETKQETVKQLGLW